jgi:hypothetical protein
MDNAVVDLPEDAAVTGAEETDGEQK